MDRVQMLRTNSKTVDRSMFSNEMINHIFKQLILLVDGSKNRENRFLNVLHIKVLINDSFVLDH